MPKNQTVQGVNPPTITSYKSKPPTLIEAFCPAVLGSLIIVVIFATLALLLLPGRLNPIDLRYPPGFENESKVDQYLDLLTDQFETYLTSPMATDVGVRAESAPWRLGLTVIGGLGYLVGVLAFGNGIYQTWKKVKLL